MPGSNKTARHGRIEMAAGNVTDGISHRQHHKAMAKATVIRPADGAENNAAPQTAPTSANVPINSAPSSRNMRDPLVFQPFIVRSKGLCI
jgi:hypothetical protein